MEKEMTLADNVGEEWADVLLPHFRSDWMAKIAARVDQQGDKLRPAKKDIFTALRLCQPSHTKIVILGQDPYPGNEAHGLSFSSQLPSIPPSLRVIFKELELSGYGVRTNPNLTDWAKQGVLMLNSVLTTTYRMANAHRDWGWQQLTQKIMETVAIKGQLSGRPVTFMLWGKQADDTATPIVQSFSCNVIRSCHPQYENYSGGKMRFTGGRQFIRVNEWLTENGHEPIKWVDNAETGATPQ